MELKEIVPVKLNGTTIVIGQVMQILLNETQDQLKTSSRFLMIRTMLVVSTWLR